MSSQQIVVPIAESEVKVSPSKKYNLPQQTPSSVKPLKSQVASQILDNVNDLDDASSAASIVSNNSSPRVIVSKSDTVSPFTIITNSPILANSKRKKRSEVSITPL